MKTFIKTLLLFSLFLSYGIQSSYADGDRDFDGVKDSVDQEDTFYTALSAENKSFFEHQLNTALHKTDNGELQDVKAISINNTSVYFNGNERIYVSPSDIGNSRVSAFQENKNYYRKSSDTNVLVYLEYKIILYICKQADIDNEKYGCSESSLGKFSEKKFKATSGIDSDNDRINDYDTNGDILDRERFTANDKIKFVCTAQDISNESDTYGDGTPVNETNGYGCGENQLGVYSTIKESYFIDSDTDGISDNLDLDNNTSSDQIQYVCTLKDIKNENDSYDNGDPIEETIGYGCSENQLGIYSPQKESFFTDSDNDDINNYFDLEDNTPSDKIKYICTPNDIITNKYECTDTQIGVYSILKESYFLDSDNDNINDFLDNEDNTPSDKIKYVCTNKDIENNRYDCVSSMLGVYSLEKEKEKGDSNDDDDSGFGGGAGNAGDNLNIGNYQDTNKAVGNNKHLEGLKDGDDDFFSIRRGGERGIFYSFVRIARDMKNVFFYIAGLFFLIIVLKLLFAENSEEQEKTLKNGILWITIGIVIMQIAYGMITLLFDKGVSQGLAYNFIDTVINPLIDLLQTMASFFFIAMAIFAFYTMVTANGNDESVKSSKMSIVYAILGFIVVKFAKTIVNAMYGKLECKQTDILGIISITENNCIQKAELSDFTTIIVDIINWMNGFIGIAVVLMIIYTGAQVLLSAGDEEKLKSAKNALIYIAIGLALLVMNYLILTFFIFPEQAI